MAFSGFGLQWNSQHQCTVEGFPSSQPTSLQSGNTYCLRVPSTALDQVCISISIIYSLFYLGLPNKSHLILCLFLFHCLFLSVSILFYVYFSFIVYSYQFPSYFMFISLSLFIPISFHLILCLFLFHCLFLSVSILFYVYFSFIVYS
jgi:hypothetical protein